MRSFSYFIREALRNSKKNFSTALGAIVTIFLSLFIIGVFMVLSLIISQLIDSVEDLLSIEIFVHDDALETDIDALEGYARSLPEVDSVKWISKEDALIRFQEQQSTAEINIIDELDGNPLPASILITLRDPEQIEEVVAKVTAYDSYLRVIDSPEAPAKSIKYAKDTVDNLFFFANAVRVVCVALVVLLVFVALIFINNTIRLAILARRKEIAIMRLVGASNGFIRGPFLMEGALQAVVGAGLAIGTIALICNNLFPQISAAIHWLPLDLQALNLWMIYLILLGVGLVIGFFGSVLAMRRYLKV